MNSMNSFLAYDRYRGLHLKTYRYEPTRCLAHTHFLAVSKNDALAATSTPATQIWFLIPSSK